MPGLDYFSKAETTTQAPAAPSSESSGSMSPALGVYYNARLDPKNYLEGPLSVHPATRLRQMLARPGIVVRLLFDSKSSSYLSYVIVKIAPGICDGISARCALEAGFNCMYQRSACFPHRLFFCVLTCIFSGAATTASRLGQPDLAIATMNDFVGVLKFDLEQTITD